MNCRDRQHDIVLFLYDELSDQARQELRIHVDDCATCREFQERETGLQSELTEDFSDWEVPSDLLVECRRNLSEELDLIDNKPAWWKFGPLAGIAYRMRLLESAALLSIGLALGVYVTNQIETPAPLLPEQTQRLVVIPQDASVANLRIIGSDQASGQVQLAGEMVQPMRVEGSLEDEEVLQLIVGALQSPSNPGFRFQAVELLSQSVIDPNIKQVLLNRLLNDDNAGVRLIALQALQAFSEEDDVRQVLKYVVENDDTPGIRVQAIEALAPMTEEEAIDFAILEAVREVPNEYIRMQELQFVGVGN
jgi:hypothetical protein